MAENKDFNFNHLEISTKRDESGPMIIMTSVFILWGFLTVMNENLNSKIQVILDLSDAQKNLLSYVFFAWYFVAGLFFFIAGRFIFDPIKQFGYKRLVIFGLLLTSLGCFLFFPVTTLAQSNDYDQEMKFIFFVSSIIVLATGFAVLQVTANPYVLLMGDDKNAAARIWTKNPRDARGDLLCPLLRATLHRVKLK